MATLITINVTNNSALGNSNTYTSFAALAAAYPGAFIGEVDFVLDSGGPTGVQSLALSSVTDQRHDIRRPWNIGCSRPDRRCRSSRTPSGVRRIARVAPKKKPVYRSLIAQALGSAQHRDRLRAVFLVSAAMLDI